MRDVAHSAASPDQAPYAVAEAVFAEAKAYLSSREAQQMSESELERELHRRGRELMRRLLQGHLDQRTPGEAAGPVEGADDVERSQRRLQERHPETTFGTVQVARPDGSRSSMAPRRSSTSRAPPSTLRCGNRPHPRGRVRLQGGACVPSPPASSKGRGYLVRNRMEFTGARWCYTVPLFHPCAGPDPPGGQLGWSRGGSEAPGATKPAATSMRTGTSTTREYQRHHAQRYADGIARPVSKPPPPPSPPRLRRVK